MSRLLNWGWKHSAENIHWDMSWYDSIALSPWIVNSENTYTITLSSGSLKDIVLHLSSKYYDKTWSRTVKLVTLWICDVISGLVEKKRGRGGGNGSNLVVKHKSSPENKQKFMVPTGFAQFDSSGHSWERYIILFSSFLVPSWYGNTQRCRVSGVFETDIRWQVLLIYGENFS